MSIRRKIFFSTLAVLSFIYLIFSTAYYWQYQTIITKQRELHLLQIQTLLERRVNSHLRNAMFMYNQTHSSSDVSPQHKAFCDKRLETSIALFHQIPEFQELQTTVFDVHAHIVGGTQLTPPSRYPFLSSPTTVVTRLSSQRYQFVLPIQAHFEPLGIVVAEYPLPPFEGHQQRKLFGILGVSACVFLCLALLGAWGVGEFVARPLRTLATTMERTSLERIPSFSPQPLRTDEIGLLTKTFIRMMLRLRASFQEQADTQRALQASETQLREILEQIPLGIAVINTKGRLVFLNTFLRKFFHRNTKSQLVGKETIELFGVAFSEHFIQKVQSQLSAASLDPFTWQCLKERWCRATHTTITWQQQEPAVMTMVTDITEEVLKEARMEAEKQRMSQELQALKQKYPVTGFVGHSKPMQNVLKSLYQFATGPTSPSVMILGESGTGKEVAARTLHQLSNRREKPFVVVNCATLPKGLLESELFGHEKGAFTGAVKTRKGRFELADGGFLFLDEIGELPLEVQAKLLRVLQEKQFEPVGSSHTKTVDVRIIVATNRNLKKEMEAGRFREDLFYRLDVGFICMPPLREHKEDIPLLVGHFLKQYAPEEFIPQEVLNQLYAYNWPGNVRELFNKLEHYLSTGQLTFAKKGWPGGTDKFKLPSSLKAAVQATERRTIADALAVCGGNRTKAAKRLQIDRRTLYDKMKKFHLD